MPAPNDEEPTVTPYAVEGNVDYDTLLDQFGADRLTDEQIASFPTLVHPLVRRKIFYAERDVNTFLDAANAGEPHSIVTGRGPSGPMHIGHVFPFYFAKHLQDQTDTRVISLSPMKKNISSKTNQSRKSAITPVKTFGIYSLSASTPSGRASLSIRRTQT